MSSSPRKQNIVLNIPEKLDIELYFLPNATNKMRAFVSRKIKKEHHTIVKSDY